MDLEIETQLMKPFVRYCFNILNSFILGGLLLSFIRMRDVLIYLHTYPFLLFDGVQHTIISESSFFISSSHPYSTYYVLLLWIIFRDMLKEVQKFKTVMISGGKVAWFFSRIFVRALAERIFVKRRKRCMVFLKKLMNIAYPPQTKRCGNIV